MKLLYFASHQMWPLTSGARLRDYHLARELALHCSVTFVEMCHPGERPSIPPDDCRFDRIISLNKTSAYGAKKVLQGMAGPKPLTALNYFHPQMAEELANILIDDSFDIVQVEGVLLSEYLPVIQAVPNAPAILIDWHNIDSEVMWRYSEKTSSWSRRLVARRTAMLLENAELSLLEQFQAHAVASERERKKILARCPSAGVHVVPNGVDTEYFSPTKTGGTPKNGDRPSSKQFLLFVGSMDYHANIDAVTWFSRKVWPKIASTHPHLQFIIVGRNPAPEIRALASDRIRVTGTVDEVRSFYACATAVVVPLRSGSGTRLKILEAMAAGVPVVSTRLGAEGIDAADGVHFFLADSSSEIAAAVGQIVTSAETRARLSQAARDLVTRYDWKSIGAQLYRICRDLVEVRQPVRSSRGCEP